MIFVYSDVASIVYYVELQTEQPITEDIKDQSSSSFRKFKYEAKDGVSVQREDILCFSMFGTSARCSIKKLYISCLMKTLRADKESELFSPQFTNECYLQCFLGYEYALEVITNVEVM